ncbi:MAG: hypothetical protein G01um101470_22 [Parcubacteria group bacterium Gr01-1014_70]|nr:MAG: hypothetical protein G01um101470_22 [Parcubacteria group bacterium Gr01-1014_70]
MLYFLYFKLHCFRNLSDTSYSSQAAFNCLKGLHNPCHPALDAGSSALFNKFEGGEDLAKEFISILFMRT